MPKVPIFLKLFQNSTNIYCIFSGHSISNIQRNTHARTERESGNICMSTISRKCHNTTINLTGHLSIPHSKQVLGIIY